MKLTVLAITKEDTSILTENGNFNIETMKDLETYSGKAAGVCYMKDHYFNTNVDNEDKAKSRFYRVAATGHHSIADHSFISVLFEGIPKMTAMILNSVGFYNTSEKSGRYTIMNSEEQCGTDSEKLYYKWLHKFKKLISEHDKTLAEKDPKLVEKLAMENARYVLSVFAPNTTMMYTTSLRMWSYLVCWCKDYINSAKEVTEFDTLVKKCVHDLYVTLLGVQCYSETIVDNKNRNFNFLSKQVDFPIWDTQEMYLDSYLIKYNVSFACLAQEQRHRTLRYYMNFDGSQKLEFYIPKILTKEEDKKEWLQDLNSIKETFPIATKVSVIETGLISDFMLKCDERLCGRVLLETMENVKTNLLKFARDWNKTPFTIHELNKHIKDGKIITKCGNISCKEPCYWGAKNALTRLV